MDDNRLLPEISSAVRPSASIALILNETSVDSRHERRVGRSPRSAASMNLKTGDVISALQNVCLPSLGGCQHVLSAQVDGRCASTHCAIATLVGRAHCSTRRRDRRLTERRGQRRRRTTRRTDGAKAGDRRRGKKRVGAKSLRRCKNRVFLLLRADLLLDHDMQQLDEHNWSRN